MAQRKLDPDAPGAQPAGRGALSVSDMRSETMTWFTDRRCYEERLDEFLASAVDSIHIVAVTCKLASPTGDLHDMLVEKLHASAAFQATVSLLDYDAPAVAILADSLAVSRTELRRHLRSVWQEWVSFSASLATASSRRFRLMQHKCLPFGSAFIVDAERPHGTVHVETRLFGELPDDTFAYRIKGPGVFFRRNVASWQRVIEKSRPYNATDVAGGIVVTSRRSRR